MPGANQTPLEGARANHQLAAVRGVRRSQRETARLQSGWKVADQGAYAYLLGCYLGDGYIVYKPPTSWTLLIACDRQYPTIEAEIQAAMAGVFPEARPRVRQAADNASDIVVVSHPAIGRAFPQHGVGPKHEREIVLADWQLEVTHARPEALIRGLIHSDGCRVLNRFRTRLPSGRVAEYAYTRYFFSNLSADIRAIFSDHCRLLGVKVTQSNPRNLTVSSRASVEKLDRFVGPKT